jgi:hypothetical protein
MNADQDVCELRKLRRESSEEIMVMFLFPSAFIRVHLRFQ